MGCQACVCDQDAYCCDTGWDDTCAGTAAILCEVCGGEPASVCGDACGASS